MNIRKIIREELLKFLFESCGEFGAINEAMIQINSIPEDVILVHGKRGVDDFLILYNYINKRVIGIIAFKEYYHTGEWEVSVIAADRGYGPLMYEMVMMYIYPKGLMPSRSGDINDNARIVWEKFWDRNEIKKEPIKKESGMWAYPFFSFIKDGNKDDDEMLSLFNSKYFKSPTPDFHSIIDRSEKKIKEYNLNVEDIIERGMNYFSANYS